MSDTTNADPEFEQAETDQELEQAEPVLINLVLINPETNQPYDVNDPVVISKELFDDMNERASELSMTFEEYFIGIVKACIKLDIEADSNDLEADSNDSDN